MSIMYKKFSTKKSSISCLLSILLSATALTAPVAFSGTSFGMEASHKDTEKKATDIHENMKANYENISTKNESLDFTEINASKLVEEGKVTVTDKNQVIAPEDYFNPAHQMDFIAKTITQNKLNQLPAFNKILELARKNDTTPRSAYKIAVSEMLVKTYFKYFYKQFLDKSYLEVPLDVALRQALSKALFNLAIECEAIQEAIKFEENNATNKIEEKRKSGETKINQLKLDLDTEKNKLEELYGAKISEISDRIDSANEHLQIEEDQGNKSALIKKIRILENNRKKEIDTKEGLIRNLESNLKNEEIKLKQDLVNLEKENKIKFNSGVMSFTGLRYGSFCYSYKLSVIFDNKGTTYTKTLWQYKNGEPFYRTDSPYWVEFYKILAAHPEIEYEAKINLYDSILHVLQNQTDDAVEIATFKKWFGISNNDVKEVEQFRVDNQRSPVPEKVTEEAEALPAVVEIEEYPALVSPVTNTVSKKQQVMPVVEPGIKVNNSPKVITNVEEKESSKSSKLTQEEARVTNDIASQLIGDLTQKKKSEEKKREHQQVERKEPLPIVTVFPQKSDTLKPVSSSSATVLVSSNTDQKKNGVSTTYAAEQRYGRNNTSRTPDSNRGYNSKRTNGK